MSEELNNQWIALVREKMEAKQFQFSGIEVYGLQDATHMRFTNSDRRIVVSISGEELLTTHDMDELADSKIRLALEAED